MVRRALAQFAYGDKVHIRRVHYQIVSQRTPVMLPNGKPYENTAECWDMLNMASKVARYLQLVDPAAFTDRRNDDPVICASSCVGSTRTLRCMATCGKNCYTCRIFLICPPMAHGGFMVSNAITWKCGVRSLP